MADDKRPNDGVRRSRRQAPQPSKVSKRPKPRDVGDVHFDVSMARAMAFNTPAKPEETPPAK